MARDFISRMTCDVIICLFATSQCICGVAKTRYNIYITISQNIRYLLWNRGFCRSLSNTYPIFLTPCIRCTNHLCDSCDLTDVNQHFIPSLHSKCWPIVTSSILEPTASNCDVTMTDCSGVVAMGAFLAQLMPLMNCARVWYWTEQEFGNLIGREPGLSCVYLQTWASRYR